MKLIIGLGNPGREYKYSRHNIGLLLINRLSKEWRIKIKSDLTTKSRWGRGRFEKKDVALAYPLSYMNLSGYSVELIVRKLKLSPKEEILLVFDDLDLEFGKIRIRAKGDSGGHRGVESIIKALGISDFTRLRLGIGRPQLKERVCQAGKQKEVVDYVLGSWTRQERNQLDQYLARAANCCRTWIISGIAKAMNEFNPAPSGIQK